MANDKIVLFQGKKNNNKENKNKKNLSFCNLWINMYF